MHRKWQGQCTDCTSWNSLVQEASPTAGAFVQKSYGGKGSSLRLDSLEDETVSPSRYPTGIGEFDQALGGGLVLRSAILMGGDPGIGKSTLLLQIAAGLAADGRSVVYVSGEESIDQLRMRAHRLGFASAPLQLLAATSVEDILATLEAQADLDLVVIDSIQTMICGPIDSAPGTVSQVRAATHALIRFIKSSNAVLIVVGHMTKDGQIAGPRVLEHMVDTVLSFEGERNYLYRLLRVNKNRFGPTDALGVFEMTAEGLVETPNPSELFLTQRGEALPGTVVFAGVEGMRPLLVEIQALVVRLPTGATPRRAVVGWDGNRLSQVLAVLEARCGFVFSSSEVYLNVAGGLRIAEPAADLAVAAALISAASNIAVPKDAVFFGEIALSGEIRPVAHGALRLKEAQKLGFTQAFIPPKPLNAQIENHQLKHLGSLVDHLFADQSGRKG